MCGMCSVVANSPPGLCGPGVAVARLGGLRQDAARPPAAALDYLARYTPRTAIGNRAIAGHRARQNVVSSTRRCNRDQNIARASARPVTTATPVATRPGIMNEWFNTYLPMRVVPDKSKLMAAISEP
jgi:hypothetical protein